MDATHSTASSAVHRIVLLLAAAVVAACGVAPFGVRPAPTPTAPLADVTAAALRVHLAALDTIARENGGNRALGTPGYDASADYATRILTAAGYEVSTDTWPVQAYSDPGGNELAVLGANGRTFADRRDFLPLLYSPRGTVEARLAVISDPCVDGAFDAVPAGFVLFVDDRGSCDLGLRLAGLDVRALVFASTMPAGSMRRSARRIRQLAVPEIAASAEASAVLKAAAGASVRVRVTGFTTTELTRNVVAELRGSDPERLIVLGAHLDSTIDGPGLDDNGTGVAAVLEIARSLAGSQPVATIRFALWAGEEEGFLGSSRYLANSTADTHRTQAYLNADMLGARNGIRSVYSGSAVAGDAVLARRLADALRRRGLAVEGADMVGASDSSVFRDASVATAGVISIGRGPKTAAEASSFGGSVGEMDACYHRSCDDLANVDLARTKELADALAVVLVDLAYRPAGASSRPPSGSPSTSPSRWPSGSPSTSPSGSR